MPTLRMIARPVAQWIGWVVKGVAQGLSVVTVVMLVLAYTRVPFDVHRWLGHAAGGGDTPPEVIVVLGGSGMPSGPELLRLHHAAYLAAKYPQASVVVIHPDSASTMQQMVSELVLRQVQANRIRTISRGENTREQALIIAQYQTHHQGQVVVVTAPENMYRTVRAFRKAGVENVYGEPAWDHAMQHPFVYHHAAIGGKAWTPDVSEQINLRYTFWNYLKLEITCLREFVAIAYYQLNGWI